jgi:DNA-binding beta-propeller fold protein YncE
MRAPAIPQLNFRAAPSTAPRASDSMRGRTMLRAIGVMLAMSSLAGAIHAQSAPTPSPALLVLAKKDTRLAIVDPATLQVVARIDVGINPHEVAASADGRTAWVTNYDNGSANTIHVIDLVSQKVLKVIDLGPLWGPHGLAVSSGKTYFTAEREKLIGRIDPVTETVDWEMGTGQTGTHMLWVSPDAKKIVTVNVGSGTLSLLTEKPIRPEDLPPHRLSKQGGVASRGKGGPEAPDWDENVVKVGGWPEGFDVLTDAEGNPQTIWVANAVEGTISIVDFNSHAVTGTIDAGLKTANRLRFTPDRKYALVSREKDGNLAVIDVASQKVVHQIPVGTGAAGVSVQPDGARAYVSCSPDNWVAVVDLHTMQVVGKIHPGTEPDGLYWAVRQ